MDTKKNKPGSKKTISTNSMSLSLTNLAEEIAAEEKNKKESFSENPVIDNDKEDAKSNKKASTVDFDELLFKNLEKVKECKENSLFTNIRIRKEFRNYLNQIRFLEQFQDYTMGDILEAVVNTYMEPHIDTLKKQSLLRKSL